MKVKINKSLMEEFARVYNAWNEKHDLEPVQDIQTLANMALAKAIVAMRESVEVETKKYIGVNEIGGVKKCLR